MLHTLMNNPYITLGISLSSHWGSNKDIDLITLNQYIKPQNYEGINIFTSKVHYPHTENALMILELCVIKKKVFHLITNHTI